jgi:hypothetical protein
VECFGWLKTIAFAAGAKPAAHRAAGLKLKSLRRLSGQLYVNRTEPP